MPSRSWIAWVVRGRSQWRPPHPLDLGDPATPLRVGRWLADCASGRCAMPGIFESEVTHMFRMRASLGRSAAILLLGLLATAFTPPSTTR